MSTADRTPEEIVGALVDEIRTEAGGPGAVNVLEKLRALNPYDLQAPGGLKKDEPLPVFFQDGWNEIFDLLIAKAKQQCAAMWGDA